MKDFLVLIREPDGRSVPHSEDETALHRQKMNEWFGKYSKKGHIKGGSALSLTGGQIKGPDASVIKEIHRVGTEIVGGFIILSADDLDDAIAIMQSFPVYEVDGHVEVREFMQT